MRKYESLSLRGVEIFVAVVEERSITGAARRLGASLSSVSQQLSNLEEYLDARLIERSTRNFILNVSGRDLFSARHRLVG